MILILADLFDAHADAVEKHLTSASVRYFRFNLDAESLRASHIHFDGESWRIQQGDQIASSDDMRCVWPRRLTVSLDLEQQTGVEDSSFRLWRAEWNRCLYGLYSALRGRFWMNSIAQSSLADNKYTQITAARRHGFLVPETISSNCPEELRRFARKHGFVALKFMSQEIYRMPDGSYSGIYVNRISEAELAEFGDHGENPVTLQRYVDKAYEVRYTYVNGTHLVCRIDSQDSERASIDWRRYDVPNTPHSIIDPPDVIRDRVTILMVDLGLSYGALDFIVDGQDNWWYLEVNSAGQWLWIEDLVGLPISATIARTLDEHRNGATI